MKTTNLVLNNLGITFLAIGRHMYYRDLKLDQYTADYLLSQMRHGLDMRAPSSVRFPPPKRYRQGMFFWER